MATYTVTSPGNTALQQEIWTLSLAEARALIAHFDCRPGTYWQATVKRPYALARCNAAQTVRVYTAGFSSGELSNALVAAGFKVTTSALRGDVRKHTT